MGIHTVASQHEKLVKEIDNYINRRRDARIFPNPNGTVIALHGKVSTARLNNLRDMGLSPFILKYGMGNGSPDQVGYVMRRVTPDMVGKEIPVPLLVESKTGSDVLRPKQEIWRREALRAGCVHVVARGVEDVNKIFDTQKNM